MSINVISKIKPKNNGQFPVVEDSDIEGSLRIVDTLIDRDNIPDLNRKEGMLVKVMENEITYTLSGGISNANWITNPIVPGVSPQSLSSGISKDKVNLIATKNGVDPFLDAPRQVISDGSYLYVAQSTQDTITKGMAIIWKFSVNGSVINSAESVDLGFYFPGQDVQVRTIAQDSTYLYATLWDTGNVAIITKSTMTVAGWANVGSRTVGVAADDLGNFYVTSASAIKRVSKFTTASHLGQPPNNAVAAAAYALNGNNVKEVRYGGGKLWITKGGGGAGNVFYKVDPTTMTLDMALATVGTNTFVISTLYAFGYVWVGAEAGEVYKLDPTTLSVMPGYPLTVPGDTPYIMGLGTGADAGGTPDSRIYIGTLNAAYTNSINPNTDSWDYVSNVTVETSGYFEGIASMGSYVYFPNWFTTHVAYYNPVLAEAGTIKAAEPTFSWEQKYEPTNGDLVQGQKSLLVNNLKNVLVSNTAPADGEVLTATQTYLFEPNTISYDIDEKTLWISTPYSDTLLGYDDSTSLYKRIYWKQSNVHNIPELNSDNIHYMTGTTSVVQSGDYLFATSIQSSNKAVFVFDKRSGESISAGKSDRFGKKWSCLVADGYVFVLGEELVEKFNLSDLTSRNSPYANPIASLALNNTEPFYMVNYMGYDGTYLYAIEYNTTTVHAIDPVTMTSAGSWTHPLAYAVLTVFVAFGYVWAAGTNTIYRLDFTNPLVPVATAVTGLPSGTWQNIASDGTYLWATDMLSSTIAIIDPATYAYIGMATNSVATDKMRCLAFDGYNKMWVTHGTSIFNNSGISSYYTINGILGDEAFRSLGPIELQYVASSSFTAGGDLSGTSSSQTVTGIQSIPVSASTPFAGHTFVYNGAQWVSSFPAGDLSGSYPSVTVSGIQSTPVSVSSPNPGDMFYFDGIQWAPGTIGGDLSGSYPAPTVAKVNGVSVSGTPSSGQVLTASSGTAASWQTPTTPTVDLLNDNGTVNRAVNRALAQGFGHRNLYYTTSDSFTAITDSGEGVILALKSGQYVRMYDSISGIPTSLQTSSSSVYSVDLTTATFTQILYVGGRLHQQGATGASTQQFVFVAGPDGYRRVEFKFNSTGGSGAIVNSDTSYAVRAMVYDGLYLYLWDQTNGKIVKITNPNADRTTNPLSSTDLTSNGTVPVASATGQANLMTFDGYNIWCVDGNKLFKIIVSTGSVSSYTFSVAGSGRAVYFDGKWLWVSTSSNLRRVNPYDSDPANNGTAISGSVSGNLNWADIISSDGDLLYIARTGLTSATYSMAIVDPETCYVIQEMQGPYSPSGMSVNGAGSSRRVTVCAVGSASTGTLWRIDKAAPLQTQTLKSTGARFKNQRYVALYGASYYVHPEDHIIPVTTNGGASTGAMTIYLPTMGAASYSSQGGSRGRELIICDLDGNAAAYNITIQAAAGDTINGGASVTISSNYGSIRIYWLINPLGAMAGSGWIAM